MTLLFLCSTVFTMDERDKEVIQKMYVRLLENLEAKPLLSYLYQECVLSEDDKERIQKKRRRKKRAEKLIDIIQLRKNGLKMLIKALLVNKVQAFLADELLEFVTWMPDQGNGRILQNQM